MLKSLFSKTSKVETEKFCPTPHLCEVPEISLPSLEGGIARTGYTSLRGKHGWPMRRDGLGTITSNVKE